MKTHTTSRPTRFHPDDAHDPGADRRHPLRWRGKPRWPVLPSLEDYDRFLEWPPRPATGTQMRHLRSFGLAERRPLSWGEAHHLLGECLRLADGEPLDAASKARLERVRGWHEGCDFRDLRRRVNEVLQQNTFRWFLGS